MAAINIEKEIRAAVDTGKVIMGERETIKAVNDSGVKIVIYASNCKGDLKDCLKKRAEIAGVSIYEFGGSSLELGEVCGRPHLISMLGIVSAGDSEILKLER